MNKNFFTLKQYFPKKNLNMFQTCVFDHKVHEKHIYIFN
jgi:hypothetical protein